MKNHIDPLTGLRGFAALWVMLFHASGLILPLTGINAPVAHLSAWMHFDISPIFKGGKGVDIFFVLTGFLLFLPFADKLLNPEKHICIKTYFQRRYLRILPAYYAQIIILVTLGWFGLYETASLASWTAHIGLFHNFSSAWSGFINGVWWTLPIEFEFYLLLPLFFLFIRKFGITVFMLLALLIMIAWKLMVFGYFEYESIPYKGWLLGQLPNRMMLFAWGMLAAYMHKMRFFRGVASFWFVFSAWILLSYFNHSELLYWNDFMFNFKWDFLFGIGLFLFIGGISANDSRLGNVLLSNKLIMYFGTISYSLYLWHLPILRLIFQNQDVIARVSGPSNHLNIVIATAVFVTCTIAISHLSYNYIEKPFLRKV